jgi:hypothetical protein
MNPRTRFAILALISLGCATGENTDLGDIGLGAGGTSSAAAGSGGSNASSSSGSGTMAGSATSPGTAGSGVGGSGLANGGTFATAGTGNAGMGTGLGGGSGGSAAGSGGSGTAGSSVGSAGKSSGGAAGTSTGGTPASGGTGSATAYCDTHAKSALPYTVNEGFQPSGWQGDTTAVSATPVAPMACNARVAGSVGICSTWTFTPNAAAAAWAGVSWTTMWDANTTHAPVCLAAGATKITFQARGAQGGEVVTFSGAGAAEVPFTLTNAWKEYSISLAGVQYNTFAAGVTSGFFWKVAPPTPAGAPVTFFVDDIQFVK